VRQISHADAQVRLWMSTPGVGPVVALTYVSAIDDPKHFTSSKPPRPGLATPTPIIRHSVLTSAEAGQADMRAIEPSNRQEYCRRKLSYRPHGLGRALLWRSKRIVLPTPRELEAAQ
jgi:hypothetical protein